MKKRILIIDGTYLVCRSYFGTLYSSLKLENSKGEATNAIVGFFNTFFKLLRDYNPYQVFFCFDCQGKTFRHQMYSDYKAQRDKAPEDFYHQFLAIKQVIKDLNFYSLENPEFEADDIIASLALKAKENHDVLIYSADGDLNQLIDDNITLLKPKVKQIVEVTKENFKDFFEIMPDQIVDYKAMIGDSSDNFKGIKGIGPKTATKLLLKYKTLDNIFQNINDLDEKTKNKFILYKDDVLRDKILSQLRYDVPIESFDILDTKMKIIISEPAFEIIEKYELWKILSILRKLEY
ncbi:5'-3' exonuclease [Mycoplasma phocoenae]|uniref:5'-3' exonuclease n=1 Tax=Mycoplasma phocoenae TaxID=754517 RepID=A0A858U7F8_9MOLU|nr:5'-3' exonuclease H3TH domain-containing protein [Mycoplasma phocoenae]QJG67195.1 DNA polymerase I [Mycoplasma phocoenae]